MAKKTASIKVLLPPDLKQQVKDAIRNDPTYSYKERDSQSAFARDALVFFLAHKYNNMNQQNEFPPAA